MGSSLGPVLANIILTEFERLIVSELIGDGTIKFYKRYVDDTLVLIKPSDISAVLAKFNSFDPNLTFTFSEGIVHFLDIKVSVDGTDIYRKDTHTDQYSHFSSFEPFYLKTAWVKSLYHCSFKICSAKSLLNNQIEIIKSFRSWNGYPKNIENFLMKKRKTKYSDSSTSVTVNEGIVDNLPKIWIRIPYLGSHGDSLLKSCLNKVQIFLSKPVKFITIYDTKNFHILFPTKNKLPPLSHSNVVYEVACPGCGLSIRLKEHATRLSSSAVGEHFSECEHAQYLVSLQNQFTLLNDLPLPSDNLSPVEILVLNNYKILHSTKSNNYNILASLEALLIKHNKPFLNTGLKASKELQLFT